MSADLPAIVLVDTSVLVELLRVPNLYGRHEQIVSEFMSRHERGETLLLPVASVFETGNHIAQNGDGRQRRAAAKRFVELVAKALRGDLPFTPTRDLRTADLSSLIEGFADDAMREVSLGDRSILQELTHQRRLHHRGRPVEVWTLDQALSAAATAI